MYKYLKINNYVNTFLPSIANLNCIHSDRQMYPQGYMYPRLGTPVLTEIVASFGSNYPQY